MNGQGTDHHNCGSTVVIYLAKVNLGQLRLNVGEVAEEFAVDGNLEQVFCGHHREVEDLTQIEGKSAVIFWRKVRLAYREEYVKKTMMKMIKTWPDDELFHQLQHNN